jgi:hypothetical protein
MTPEKRLQMAAQKLTTSIRLDREAQVAIRLALKQIVQRKALGKAERAT